MRNKKMMFGLLTVVFLTACGQPTTQTTSSEQTSTTALTTTTQATTATQTANAPKDAVESVQILEQEENLTLLLQKFAQQFGTLDITGIELQSSAQPYVYKVSAMDDTTEYEFSYQASTQNFVQIETERTDGAPGSERSRERIDISQLRNVNEIIATALTQAANAQMSDWSVDKDNGRVVWSVDIYENRRTLDVKIDNATGQVIEVDD